MKNAVGYLRLSTQEQDEKFGLEAQKSAIENYAKENGYVIVEWVKDVISGVKENRSGLDRILFDPKLANPPYEAVIVFKSDRVARDIKLYFYFLFLLEKKGVKLISVNEDFDSDDPLVNVQRALMIFCAEQERRNINMRTSGGRSIKAKCGGYAGGGVPYGYKVVQGHLEIDEKEAYVVREIFGYRLQNMAYQKIADELNKRGLYTKTGSVWNGAKVFYIVKNVKMYCGLYRYGKNNDYVQGQHEPILKGKEFKMEDFE